MQTVKIKKSKTKMIAHRGLSGIEPQNTSIAFAAAGNAAISELKPTYISQRTANMSLFTMTSPRMSPIPA